MWYLDCVYMLFYWIYDGKEIGGKFFGLVARRRERDNKRKMLLQFVVEKYVAAEFQNFYVSHDNIHELCSEKCFLIIYLRI